MRGAEPDPGRRPIQLEQLPDSWLPLFNQWLAEAQAAEAMRLPEFMVLATVDDKGHPSARTVHLKHVDANGFVFETNYRSPKARHIDATPQVSLVFGWHELHRQVVVNGVARRADAAESDRYFDAHPAGQSVAIAVSPESEVIADRTVLERARDELLARLPDGELPRPTWLGCYRVVPTSVEFWQEQPDHLHDRFRFRRTADGWVVERLAP